MRRSLVLLVALGGLISSVACAQAGQPRSSGDPGAALLIQEARRIEQEAKRIGSDASLMRSEGDRLNHEGDGLRQGASRLDQMWEAASRANPERYKDYDGRDRSQKRMRLDANREDLDADALRLEGKRLDDEANRLLKLAAAVNSEA